MNSQFIDTLMSDSPASDIQEDFRGGVRPRNRDLETLTRRELETLQLIACGYARKEIALRMRISRGTVDQFVKRVYDKLRVHSKTEAAILYLASRNGGFTTTWGYRPPRLRQPFADVRTNTYPEEGTDRSSKVMVKSNKV